MLYPLLYRPRMYGSAAGRHQNHASDSDRPLHFCIVAYRSGMLKHLLNPASRRAIPRSRRVRTSSMRSSTMPIA